MFASDNTDDRKHELSRPVSGTNISSVGPLLEHLRAMPLPPRVEIASRYEIPEDGRPREISIPDDAA